MISVFPSTATHFVHQRPGTQVEIMGDALEVKLCKPILNYRIYNISELPYFQTTRIHGYDDRLLTHSPEKLEPYTMLEIFSDVHYAMQEVKSLQMDHENGDTLLGISKALGATLESVASGGSYP